MIIPDKIKIYGRTFEIIKSDRNKNDGVNNSGSVNTFFQTIWIDNTAHIEVQESTLIHEILEAIDKDNDLGLSHTQLCVLENGLYQTLKDNDLLK